jgi:hypothetical protein
MPPDSAKTLPVLFRAVCFVLAIFLEIRVQRECG